MGADIHMVLERRNPKTGKWVGQHGFRSRQVDITVYPRTNALDDERPKTFNNIHVPWEARSRNYTLFAALAGVRGSGPAPRGMPYDVSDLAIMLSDEWGVDAHSHSWLLMSEALPIFIEHVFSVSMVAKRVNGDNLRLMQLDLLDSEFGVDVESDREIDEALKEYRLVFWFDN